MEEKLSQGNNAEYESFNQNDDTIMSETYTVEEAIEQIGLNKFSVIAGAICCLLIMSDNLEIGVLPLLGPNLLCLWNLTSLQMAFISISSFIGTFVGSILFGMFSNKYGRKPDLILSTVCTGYFGILSAASPNYAWVCVLRFLSGFCVGGYLQSVVYVNEVTPSKYRSKVTAMTCGSYIIASILVNVVAVLVLPSIGWRPFVAILAVPLLFISIPFLWLPESPAHFAAKGDLDKAQKSLAFIYRTNRMNLPSGKLVLEQPDSSEALDRPKPTYGFTLLDLQFAVVYFAAFMLLHAAVFLNVEVLRLYNTDEANNGHNTCSLECASLTFQKYRDILIVSTGGLLSILTVNVLSELMGRRMSLVTAFIFSGCCLLILIFKLPKILAMIVLAINFALGITLTGIAVLLSSEAYPARNRSFKLGIFLAAARLASLLQPLISQVIYTHSHVGALVIVIVVAIIGGVTVITIPIETKGQQLKA